MVTSRRRKSLSVIEQIQQEPARFDFFQAVRLLERTATLHNGAAKFASTPVANSGLPGDEAIRFETSQQLSFKGSDLEQVTTTVPFDNGDSNRADHQWLMSVNFMGLTGSQGVMPYYLSELVLRELKQKRSTLKSFLELFNHRSIALFFKAWHKYQLPANFERSRQQSQASRNGRNKSQMNHDLFTDALLCLSGLGTLELRYRLPISDDVFAGFAGSLSRSIRTADELQGMIKGLFQLNVNIEQFQGQWQELPEDIQTRLPGNGNRGINNQLGSNAVLGRTCYQIQNKFTVVIDPMPYEKFMELAPGSKKLEALKSFIRFSVGAELDFDIKVSLIDREVPPAQLVETENYQPLLGWNSHLSHSSDQDNLTHIHLSQNIDAPDDSLPTAH